MVSADISGPAGTEISARKRLRDTLDVLKTDPFVLSMFFCLLLLGGDRIAITVGDLTFRIVFPLLMSAFFFLYLKVNRAIAFDAVLGFFFMLLAAVGSFSVINSLAPFKSIGYAVWVLFDFFVIVSLCYNLARNYSPRLILSVWLWVFRVHAILVALEIFLGLASHQLYRPRLWFYETSYLAIFMTAYFGAALYLFLREGRRYLFDLCASTTVMAVLSSATGLAGVLFCILLNFVLAKQRVKLLLAVVLLGAAIFSIGYFFFRDTLYFRLMAGFLLEPETPLKLIIARGGNRYIRLLVGWDAFMRHPWFGVGIGGDSAYLASSPFPDEAWALVRPSSGLEGGEPFTNIFVEVLGTMGLAGFLPFLCILTYSVVEMIRLNLARRNYATEGTAFFLGFFSSFLALQFDGTFLRYYLWAPLGLALGVCAQARSASSGKIRVPASTKRSILEP